MDSWVSLSIDGAKVDLSSITSHHQADPFPGGHRYEVEVEDYDFLTLLGNPVFSERDNPPSAEIAHRVLNALSLLKQLKHASGDLKYWLNTVDHLLTSKGNVYTKVHMSGVCSPHVTGFFDRRVQLGGSKPKVTVSARVFWVPSEKGGRAHLPKGLEYSTVSKWPNQTDEEWLRSAWSVVLTFDQSPAKQGSPSSTRVGFLADDAPIQWLQSGQKFELFEGRQKVADVQIDG